MSAAQSIAQNSASVTSVPKQRLDDVGWDYGFPCDPARPLRVKCKLCEKMGGGVNRLKQHIAHVRGNVIGCPKSSEEDKKKCKRSLDGAQEKKSAKRAREEEARNEVNIEEKESAVDDEGFKDIGESAPRKLGPMDKFTTSIFKRQTVINEVVFKEKTHKCKQYVARCLYAHGIPFNAIDNDEFKGMLEAIGQFGPGFAGPSQYECREKLLKEEVERTKKDLKTHEEMGALTGCSIMTDAWTDQKRRSIMNLCVHCSLGTSFLRSKEVSNEAHTSEFIFDYVYACIEEIGPQHVVQVVTDNASNNMGAKNLLLEKIPNIFWTSCATHTVNLMLQAIGSIPSYKKTIDQARSLTIFIYAHHKTLALMRKHTKKRDIIRPGVTRFASSFLTLQSLIEKKTELKNMAVSKEWEESSLTKKGKGKVATSTILRPSFWRGVGNLIKVFEPLVKVLRMVDLDNSSMAFLYGEIIEAKKQIKEALHNLEANYKLIMEAIDVKMNGRLDSPLHKACYLLNPYYSYRDKTIFHNVEINEGFQECIERFFDGDMEAMDLASNAEFDHFKDQNGAFGRTIAQLGCQKFDFSPANWWTKYGGGVPNLQRMAIRILSLTSSSSGCERNWSTFDMVHTKRRNRLDAQRASDRVFVQFNARLLSKKERSKTKNVDVLLSNVASNAQEWLVEGCDDDIDEANEETEAMQLRRSLRVRELHEDDFKSDSESGDMEVEDEDVEFESDHDEVLPTKDYEQDGED